MFLRSFLLVAAAAGAAEAFQPALRAGVAPKANARSGLCDLQMQDNGALKKAALGLAVPALLGLGAGDVNAALTTKDIRSLNYGEIKGTGLANRCPEVGTPGENIKVGSGKYKITDMCLEPKSFQIEVEVSKRRGEITKEFVDTKLMTRATYSITGIEGPLTNDGGLTFKEKEGLDYAATTVQLPGGERVPFMFTIKELVAKSSSSEIAPGTEFGGTFRVPSYRSGLFLDPKGRGGTTGYDMAVALPGMEADGAEGQGELYGETNKVFQVTDGSIEFAVNKVDAATGEFSGVFVSEQLSDTDMGSKAPKKVLLKGIIFGKVSQADGSEDY
jgi:photosystem II oxygen-evolving enhancer protein 1